MKIKIIPFNGDTIEIAPSKDKVEGKIQINNNGVTSDFKGTMPNNIGQLKRILAKYCGFKADDIVLQPIEGIDDGQYRISGLSPIHPLSGDGEFKFSLSKRVPKRSATELVDDLLANEATRLRAIQSLDDVGKIKAIKKLLESYEFWEDFQFVTTYMAKHPQSWRFENVIPWFGQIKEDMFALIDTCRKQDVESINSYWYLYNSVLDKDGRTALMCAIPYDWPGIVHTLIDAGVDRGDVVGIGQSGPDGLERIHGRVDRFLVRGFLGFIHLVHPFISHVFKGAGFDHLRFDQIVAVSLGHRGAASDLLVHQWLGE